MRNKLVKNFVAATLLLSTVLTVGCGSTGGLTTPDSYYDPNEALKYNPANGPSELSKRAVDGVRPNVVIKNMFFRCHSEVGAVVHDLFGELVPRVATDPVNFDDVNSFHVQVHQAKLSLDGKNMDNLMKYFVLNYPEAPLSELKHTITDGRITITGKMKQAGLNVPFEMSGPIHATPEGLMELTPDSIKTLGLPSKGLLDFLGIQTQKLLNLNEQRGMKLVGNSIIMYPDRMFPPPIMKGKVTRVELTNDQLMMYFDDGTRLQRPPLPVPEGTFKNYQHVYGGAVRMVGNETHENANLLMVDMNESNLFDFSISEYINHTIAGQVNILNKTGALINFMPDYNDIPKRMGRKPVFDSLEDGLGGNMPQNPNSNPGLAKRKSWANQPQPVPINNGTQNRYY